MFSLLSLDCRHDQILQVPATLNFQTWWSMPQAGGGVERFLPSAAHLRVHYYSNRHYFNSAALCEVGIQVLSLVGWPPVASLLSGGTNSWTAMTILSKSRDHKREGLFQKFPAFPFYQSITRTGLSNSRLCIYPFWSCHPVPGIPNCHPVPGPPYCYPVPGLPYNSCTHVKGSELAAALGSYTKCPSTSSLFLLFFQTRS